jgi:hypothetical protein
MFPAALPASGGGWQSLASLDQYCISATFLPSPEPSLLWHTRAFFCIAMPTIGFTANLIGLYLDLIVPAKKQKKPKKHHPVSKKVTFTSTQNRDMNISFFLSGGDRIQHTIYVYMLDI